MQINPSMCTSVVFSPWLQHSRVPCGSEVWSIGVIQSINHSFTQPINQSINQSISWVLPVCWVWIVFVRWVLSNISTLMPMSVGRASRRNRLDPQAVGIQAKQAGSASWLVTSPDYPCVNSQGPPRSELRNGCCPGGGEGLMQIW